MALTANGVDLRGKKAEPTIEALVFENDTVGKSLVTFQDDVKSTTIFNESDATVQMQAFTSGVPTSAGSLTTFDVPITPVLVQYHQEFDPTSLRLSSWRDSIKPGAWEFLSTDFEKAVIGGVYSKKISFDAENKFWNHATTAYKTAVAALTPGVAQNQVSSQEQALAAASPTVTGVLFNGVIQYMIYNASNAALTAQVGGRVKVVGTTITSTNIRDEYIKVYQAVPPVVMQNNDGDLMIYAPKSHKQMIGVYNSVPTNYKSGGFELRGDTWYFLGIPISFVPIPENVIVCAKKSYINWCTDLQSDLNEMMMDQWDKRTKMWFIQSVMSIYAHVTNQAFNVLYVG